MARLREWRFVWLLAGLCGCELTDTCRNIEVYLTSPFPESVILPSASGNGVSTDLPYLRGVIIDGRSLPLWSSVAHVNSPFDFDTNSFSSLFSPSSFGSSSGVGNSYLGGMDTSGMSSEFSRHVDAQNDLITNLRQTGMLNAPPPFVFNMNDAGGMMFKVLAPATAHIDDVFIKADIPLVDVSVKASSSNLQLSYRVSAGEGTTTAHPISGDSHLSVADVDIQYKECVFTSFEETVSVAAKFSVGLCKPVLIEWNVFCPKSTSQGSFLMYPSNLQIGLSSGGSLLGKGDVVVSGRPTESYATRMSVRTFDTTVQNLDFSLWCTDCSDNTSFTTSPLRYEGIIDLTNPVLNYDGEVLSVSGTFLNSESALSGRNKYFYFGSLVSGSSESNLDLSKNTHRISNGKTLTYRLSFGCHKDGMSTIDVRLGFHNFAPITFSFKKKCSKTLGSGCSQGILSNSKLACCPLTCGNSCANSQNCQNDPKCCESAILLAQAECSTSPPPCKMEQAVVGHVYEKMAVKQNTPANFTAYTSSYVYKYANYAQFSYLRYFFKTIFFATLAIVFYFFLKIVSAKFANGEREFINLLPTRDDVGRVLEPVMVAFEKMRRRRMQSSRRYGGSTLRNMFEGNQKEREKGGNTIFDDQFDNLDDPDNRDEDLFPFGSL